MSQRAPNSRIFLGNLPSEKTSKEELLEIFGKYGKIEDVVLRRSFGFIQFDSPDAAKEAIQRENGRTIGGMRIDINMADNREPKRKGEKDEKRRDRSPPDSGARRKRSPSPDRRSKKQEIEHKVTLFCMLIYLGPSQRDYAQRIEQQIKRDVGGVECELDLVERKAIPDAISKAKKRGFNFVCVMGRQNEQKQTLALHILHPDKSDGKEFNSCLRNSTEILTEINNREAVDIIRQKISKKAQTITTSTSIPTSVAINPALIPLILSSLGLPSNTVVDSSMLQTLQQLILVQSALATVSQQPQAPSTAPVVSPQVTTQVSTPSMSQQLMQAQLLNLMSKQQQTGMTSAPVVSSTPSPSFSQSLSSFPTTSTATKNTAWGTSPQSPSTASFLANLTQSLNTPQANSQPSVETSNWLTPSRWANTSTSQQAYQPQMSSSVPSTTTSGFMSQPMSTPSTVSKNNADLLQSLLSKMSQSEQTSTTSTMSTMPTSSYMPQLQPQKDTQNQDQLAREQALLSILQKTARSGSSFASSDSTYSYNPNFQ